MDGAQIPLVSAGDEPVSVDAKRLFIACAHRLKELGVVLPKVKAPSKAAAGADVKTTSFGQSLGDIPSEKWTVAHGLRVPTVLYTIVTLMEKKHAWDQEGLYRVPGSTARVIRAKHALDAGQPLCGMHSINDIASLHKAFLRDMPDGMLSSMKAAFVQAVRVKAEDASEAINLVCQLLPPANRDLLLFQLRLWTRVAGFAEVNKMDARNLSLMLAPNVFHSQKDDGKLDDAVVESQETLAQALQLIIENMDSLTTVPAHVSAYGETLTPEVIETVYGQYTGAARKRRSSLREVCVGALRSLERTGSTIRKTLTGAGSSSNIATRGSVKRAVASAAGTPQRSSPRAATAGTSATGSPVYRPLDRSPGGANGQGMRFKGAASPLTKAATPADEAKPAKAQTPIRRAFSRFLDPRRSSAKAAAAAAPVASTPVLTTGSVSKKRKSDDDHEDAASVGGAGVTLPPAKRAAASPAAAFTSAGTTPLKMATTISSLLPVPVATVAPAPAALAPPSMPLLSAMPKAPAMVAAAASAAVSAVARAGTALVRRGAGPLLLPAKTAAASVENGAQAPVSAKSVAPVAAPVPAPRAVLHVVGNAPQQVDDFSWV